MADKAKIEPRIGPIHGVQPKAKAEPKKAAPVKEAKAKAEPKKAAPAKEAKAKAEPKKAAPARKSKSKPTSDGVKKVTKENKNGS